jgi:hypothetical protein
MLTRRVQGRVFRLLPNRKTDQVVQYVVAVMAKKWNMQVHAIIVMGNHWHVVFSDPDGNSVEFKRDCHSFIARAINAGHGDFEALWSSEPTSTVRCVEPDDMIGKIAYTMANPVAARLVMHGHSWPGVRAAWPRKARLIKRPGWFFRGPDKGGKWPDEAVLEFSRPPGYDHLSDEELATVIAAEIGRRENRERREAEEAGEKFLGRRGVLAQSRYARPKTREPRFGLSPRVACRNKWRRIETLQADKAWLDDHTASMDRWRRGDRSVVFPYGTYKMRLVHGVRCAPAPT